MTVRDASLSRTLQGVFGASTALRSRVALEADLQVPFTDPSLATGTIDAAGARPETEAGALPLGFEVAAVLDEEAVAVRRLVAGGVAFEATLEGRYPRSGNADFLVTGFAGDAAEMDAVQQEVRRVAFGEDPELTAWDVSGACRFEGAIQGPWPASRYRGDGRGGRAALLNLPDRDAGGVGADHPRRHPTRQPERPRRGGHDFRVRASSIADPARFRTWSSTPRGIGWDIREIVDFLEWDLEAESVVSGLSSTVRRDERYYGGGDPDGRRRDLSGTAVRRAVHYLGSLDGRSVRLAPMSALFRGGRSEGALSIDLVDGTMEGSVTGRGLPAGARVGHRGDVAALGLPVGHRR